MPALSDWTASSAPCTTATLEYRLPGSFCKHRWTTLRRPAETRLGNVRGVSLAMADTMSSGCSPSNGNRPLAIS